MGCSGSQTVKEEKTNNKEKTLQEDLNDEGYNAICVEGNKQALFENNTTERLDVYSTNKLTLFLKVYNQNGNLALTKSIDIPKNGKIPLVIGDTELNFIYGKGKIREKDSPVETILKLGKEVQHYNEKTNCTFCFELKMVIIDQTEKSNPISAGN